MPLLLKSLIVTTSHCHILSSYLLIQLLVDLISIYLRWYLSFDSYTLHAYNHKVLNALIYYTMNTCYHMVQITMALINYTYGLPSELYYYGL